MASFAELKHPILTPSPLPTTSSVSLPHKQCGGIAANDKLIVFAVVLEFGNFVRWFGGKIDLDSVQITCLDFGWQTKGPQLQVWIVFVKVKVGGGQINATTFLLVASSLMNDDGWSV